MKIARNRSLLVCTLLFLFSFPAAAWDDVGHKLTGYIAWQRMSPAAREEVIRILRKAPEDSHLSAYYMNYGPQSDDVRKREYFTMVPTWADIVRDRDFPIRQKKYHRSNWHYSDTFWRQVDGRVELITDKEPGGQGLVRLVEFDKVLRDTAVPDAEKAIAIAWFLHIGGDLHQPLHTSGRHTDREPNGDQGGNFFLLEPEGKQAGEYPYNLHWYWDSIVGRNIPFNDAVAEQDYLQFVARSMMNRYPFDSLKDGLKLGDYAAWREESFQLAVSDVFRPDLVRFEEPSDDYRRNAFRVAERRQVIAGYRMGETLEAIFGDKAAVADCRAIRKLKYPITKRPDAEDTRKMEILLLDICTEGIAARPVMIFERGGKKENRAFDVLKVFANEAEARKYAAENAVTDVEI